jgi:predicted MFS family arabinose efflux permease
MTPQEAAGARHRSTVIALTAFLTVVDLFATQAILPLLTKTYGVSPAAMAGAVNACTFGMAIAGLGVALLNKRIDRRAGIVASLMLLTVPTLLLATMPNLAVFTALRVVQGLCMSTAFSLTLAYLGERCSAEEQAGAFAAYVTGNVASNLIGRLIAATVADRLGLSANFILFAGFNLAGAALVFATIRRTPRMGRTMEPAPMGHAALRALAAPPLLSAFGIGFCILFAFIGIFTYVNFVLVQPPLVLPMMAVGLAYFVFLPAIFITPAAGRVVAWRGPRFALWAGLAVAGAGLPLLAGASLPVVLLGMVLVGTGTFFAQAVATGFVSRAAGVHRGAASGVYLASYFSGGLVGSRLVGFVFDVSGWPAALLTVGAALAIAALLGLNVRLGSAARAAMMAA